MCKKARGKPLECSLSATKAASGELQIAVAYQSCERESGNFCFSLTELYNSVKKT